MFLGFLDLVHDIYNDFLESHSLGNLPFLHRVLGSSWFKIGLKCVEYAMER